MNIIEILTALFGVSIVTFIVALFKRNQDMQKELYAEKIKSVEKGSLNEAKDKSDRDLADAIRRELDEITTPGTDT